MARQETIETLIAELRTLESKVDLLASKLNTIERNEEVIGRTLIALNSRIKKLEESPGGRGAGAGSDELRNYATKQEVAELKYVIDSINPLEYATIAQVRELIEEKLGRFSSAGGQEEKEKNESSSSGISKIFNKL